MDNTTKKIKTLFVITKSNWGGAQKYVFDLATELQKDSFDAVVALGGEGILADKLRATGIRTITIPSLVRDVNPLKDFASFIDLYKILKKEAPDVVHLNSAKVSGLGVIAAHLASVPKIIFTAHGWAFNEERPYWQKALIRFFSWATVMLTHKTIAVSDAVKNDTKNWPLVSSKITVIKNGIKEPDFFTREMSRAKIFSMAGISPPDKAFIVGTIAELHKSKGLSYAIEAFSKIAPKNPDIYYFILGSGEEKGHLDGLVELHKLQGRVFLLGFVNDASRFLKAFDLFLLPSTTEGLALVLLEAGLAGLPVIASRVGGIPEIITDNETGLLVPPRTPTAITEAIQKFLNSPILCEELGGALLEKTRMDFQLERVIVETSFFYKNF